MKDYGGYGDPSFRWGDNCGAALPSLEWRLRGDSAFSGVA